MDEGGTRGRGGRAGGNLQRAVETAIACPALASARERALDLARRPDASAASIADAVESDLGLSLAVLRTAAAAGGEVGSVSESVGVLGPAETAAVIAEVEGFDVLAPGVDAIVRGLSLHGCAVSAVAAHIAERTVATHVDELLTAALLHDIGKLVLEHAFPEYPHEVHSDARTPEERVAAEQRRLGVDHARIGADLLRNLGLADPLIGTVEAHHDEAPDGGAAYVRVADLLVHYRQGDPVDPVELVAVSARLGLSRDTLVELMYELTSPLERAAHRSGDCPLTGRELHVLRELASGKVYKQIATDLGLSASTVRNHLHNAYRKLGAPDRAQAVLVARESGWI